MVWARLAPAYQMNDIISARGEHPHSQCRCWTLVLSTPAGTINYKTWRRNRLHAVSTVLDVIKDYMGLLRHRAEGLSEAAIDLTATKVAPKPQPKDVTNPRCTQ